MDAPKSFEDSSNREQVFDAEEVRTYLTARLRNAPSVGATIALQDTLDDLFPEDAPHSWKDEMKTR